ncbi:hypothetical protein K4F52_006597 [Lecanicillium sp. MT-2017a]|nr:hypothetical protein K4F52_006597 [Lecanicillium sp. MT-2017a]
MTPRTRSGGAEPPPSSIVYRSTPTLRQVQFPSRRKRVRTYGRQGRYSEHREALEPSMKQQTLTQIEFVSSFNEDDDDDVVGLSDASDDGNKENRLPKRSTKRIYPGTQEGDEEARIPDTEDEGEDDDDQAPVARRRKRHVAFADNTSGKNNISKNKRRRTLGDEHRRNTMSEEREGSRRRTMGDVPVSSSSRYHTQTLTQLIGRGSFIADSDEDDEGLDGNGHGQNDDGFLDWLGTNQEEEPPSPTTAVRAAAVVPSSSPAKHPAPQSREESVIPQTPVKSIRFQLPPSAQAVSPSPARIAKYGAPDKYTSPSKHFAAASGDGAASLTELTGKPQELKSPAKKTSMQQRVPSLVIQDSYASEGWTSVGGDTQQRGGTPSQTQSQMYSTPAEAPARTQQPGETAPSQAAQTDAENEEYHEASSQLPRTPDRGAFTIRKPPPPQPPSDPARQEIPDSDEEDEAFGDDDDEEANDKEEPDESAFAAGAETQLLMDQLQSSVQKWTRPQQAPLPSSSSPSSSPRPQLHTSSSIPGSATTPQSLPPSSGKKPHPPPSAICHDIPPAPTPATRAQPPPIRKPLHHEDHQPLDTQGLPLESQRVPVATLHAFPPASARTDILLPLSAATSSSLVSGHIDSITLPFKVPAQVVRFWLLTGSVLRYLCTVDPITRQQLPDGNYAYPVTQVYELNNPVQEDDMRAEEWIHGQVARYAYFPPAVVSQLLWNLRHALFDDPDTTSDKIPSTPERAPGTSSQVQMHSSPMQTYQRPPPASTMPAPPPPGRLQTTTTTRSSNNNAQSLSLVRPSQATTASQASISTPPRSTQRQQRHGLNKELATTPTAPPAGLQNSCSDSLVFDDHGGSSISMPFAVSGLDDDSSSASQLLTKSQMLPESLVRDEVRFPNEIGDSDEE